MFHRADELVVPIQKSLRWSDDSILLFLGCFGIRPSLESRRLTTAPLLSSPPRRCCPPTRPALPRLAWPCLASPILAFEFDKNGAPSVLSRMRRLSCQPATFCHPPMLHTIRASCHVFLTAWACNLVGIARYEPCAKRWKLCGKFPSYLSRASRRLNMTLTLRCSYFVP